MKIEILFDLPVSPNMAAANANETCSYPFSAILANGDIACIYRRGKEKHTYDGVLLMQTSSDGGETWSAPLVAFDGRDHRPPRCVVEGGMGQTAAGTLLATFGMVEATSPDAYLFSEEGRKQKRGVCAVRSEDLGETWSEPTYIDTSAFPRAGITTKPLALPGDELFVPLEVETTFGANGTAAAFSTDDGRTFGPLVTCAADPAGEKNLCDARFALLDDGRILMLLWTFLESSEETITVHRSFSSDNGRTWSEVEPTGITGQIAVPVGLPSGVVIAASNFRHPPDGIRLWASPDGGETWNTDSPIQMWDVRQSRMLGEAIAPEAAEIKDEGVWDALDKYTFGTPDLIRLNDGTILLMYYATIDGICHVRACRFRVNGI